MNTNHSRITLFTLGCLLAFAVAATAQTKSAFHSGYLGIGKSFSLFGRTFKLPEVGLRTHVSTYARKMDLRRHTGVPSCYRYDSVASASARAVLFGRVHNIVYISGAGRAQHGTHGSYTRYDYMFGATREPVLSKGTTLRLLNNTITIGSTLSKSESNIVLYDDLWFFFAWYIPITIEGDVRGGYTLALTPEASGQIPRFTRTLYSRFGSTSYYKGSGPLSNPVTKVTASVSVNARADCTGLVGFPRIGVGLEHENHIFSPLDVKITTESSETKRAVTASLSVEPFIFKTWAIVKYWFGSRRWHLFTVNLGRLNWSKTLL